MMRTKFLILVTLTLTTGCARHAVKPGIDYLVGPECKVSARLMNCTPAANNPPICKKVSVSYKQGCEVLAIRK